MEYMCVLQSNIKTAGEKGDTLARETREAQIRQERLDAKAAGLDAKAAGQPPSPLGIIAPGTPKKGGAAGAVSPKKPAAGSGKANSSGSASKGASTSSSPTNIDNDEKDKDKDKADPQAPPPKGLLSKFDEGLPPKYFELTYFCNNYLVIKKKKEEEMSEKEKKRWADDNPDEDAKSNIDPLKLVLIYSIYSIYRYEIILCEMIRNSYSDVIASCMYHTMDFCRLHGIISVVYILNVN
jgi:hypothetical protein